MGALGSVLNVTFPEGFPLFSSLDSPRTYADIAAHYKQRSNAVGQCHFLPEMLKGKKKKIPHRAVK